MIYMIGVTPNKLGGIERFTQELAVQMEKCDWKLVLCFEAAPSEQVRKRFDTPNVFFEVIDQQSRSGIKQCFKLMRLIGRYRPGVLLYAFNGVLRFIPWIAVLLGVKTIFYNDRSSRPREGTAVRVRKWKRSLARLITWPLDGVICVSDFVSRCVRQEHVVRPEKIHTIHNGVDICSNGTNIFAQAIATQFRKKYSIPLDRKVILKVSWMVPEKGVDTFLQAACKVLSSEPTTHFVIIGTGHLLETYRELGSKLGLQNNITWTAAVEDPTRDGAFAAAQISCQLSMWQEAFGFTIIEAMACGVPVIATRTGGIPEIVRDGETGFLVPIDDPDLTSECMLKLLRNNTMREEIGHNARSDVMRRFNVHETARAYLALLGIHPRKKRSGPVKSRPISKKHP
jgi:glycosyltransferase involved in cell wall biosynthesis